MLRPYGAAGLMAVGCHMFCGGGGLDASEDVSIAIFQHRGGELGNTFAFPGWSYHSSSFYT